MNYHPKFETTSLAIRRAVARSSDPYDISRMVQRNINTLHQGHYENHLLDIWCRGYCAESVEKQIQRYDGVFVLENNGVICGMIQWDYPRIKGLYLDPDHIGKGFGRFLMEFMIHNLKMSGCAFAMLSCNYWVLGFYQALGFRVITRETVYWEGQPFYWEYRMIRYLSSPHKVPEGQLSLFQQAC